MAYFHREGILYSWRNIAIIKSPLKKGDKGGCQILAKLVLIKLVLVKPVLVETGNGEKEIYMVNPHEQKAHKRA